MLNVKDKQEKIKLYKILEPYDEYNIITPYSIAINNNNFELLNYLKENNYNMYDEDELLENAINNGVDYVKWIYNNGYELTLEDFVFTLISGKLDVIKYFFELDIEYNNCDMFQNALYSGNVELLDYLESMDKFPKSIDSYENIINSDLEDDKKLKTLKWMENHSFLTNQFEDAFEEEKNNVFNYIINNNQINTLNHLLDKFPNIKFWFTHIKKSIIKNKYEMFIILFEHRSEELDINELNTFLKKDKHEIYGKIREYLDNI